MAANPTPDFEAEQDDLDEDAPEHLDPDVLQDADATIAVICRWVREDHDARRRQAEIDHLLEVTRLRADCQLWDLVVAVLSLQRARGEDLAGSLVGRAFRDGQRHPLVQRGVGDGGDDRDGLPRLTEDVLADPEQLGNVIDQVLAADTGLADLGKQIKRAWARVRALVDDRTWKHVLAVEELLNQKAAVAQEVLVAWSFRRGARR